MSLLRKQQSRLFCVCCCVPAEQGETLEYILDSRFRGNGTPQPANLSVGRPLDGRGRGELLHSAKMLPLARTTALVSKPGCFPRREVPQQARGKGMFFILAEPGWRCN